MCRCREFQAPANHRECSGFRPPPCTAPWPPAPSERRGDALMSKILARCLLGLSTLLPALGMAAGVAIIPQPQHLQLEQGSYRLDARTRVEAPKDTRSREIAAFLREAIHAQTG